MRSFLTSVSLLVLAGVAALAAGSTSLLEGAVGRISVGAAVRAVAISPDGKLLAAGALDHSIMLFDVATGSTVRTFAGRGGGISSLAFSPDGETFASGSQDNSAKLWNVATGETVRTLAGHTGSVPAVGSSPDGKGLGLGIHRRGGPPVERGTTMTEIGVGPRRPLTGRPSESGESDGVQRRNTVSEV